MYVVNVEEASRDDGHIAGSPYRALLYCRRRKGSYLGCRITPDKVTHSRGVSGKSYDFK